jgi:hypothetical protein
MEILSFPVEHWANYKGSVPIMLFLKVGCQCNRHSTVTYIHIHNVYETKLHIFHTSHLHYIPTYVRIHVQIGSGKFWQKQNKNTFSQKNKKIEREQKPKNKNKSM